MKENFTPREEHLTTSFYNATECLEALRGNVKIILVKVIDGERVELPVDKVVYKVAKGIQKGASHELVDLGLGNAVTEIYNHLHK